MKKKRSRRPRSIHPREFMDDDDDDINDTKIKSKPFLFQQHMTRDDIPPETTHLIIDCSTISKLGLYPTNTTITDDTTLEESSDDVMKEWSRMIRQGQSGRSPSTFWGSRSRPSKWQSMLAERSQMAEGHFFGYTTDLEFVQLLPPSSQEEAVIIGAFAFVGCTCLEGIEVPPTLIRIGPCAFAQCRYLVNVDLPNNNGLQRIEDWAFYQCVSLRRMSIPSTTTTIGTHAFDSCYSLVDLTFQQQQEQDGGSSVSSSSALTEIQEYAFWKCHSLCAVSIPPSTYLIGKCAFADCTRLFGLELSRPSHKPFELGRSCFAGCYSLVHLSLPLSTTIGSLAFAECPYKSQHFLDRFARIDNSLSVHRSCYHSSSLTNLDHLRALVATATTTTAIKNGDAVTDEMGMTPFHIVATSASLRLDIFQVLLEEYSSSWKVLAHKDKRDKSAMDYLLLNQSSKAVPLIQMILKQVAMQLVDGSHQWRGNRSCKSLDVIMDTIHQASSWEQARDARARRELLDNLLKALISYTKLESTSILEEALWKRTMMEECSTTTKKNVQNSDERHDCRVVCNANVIVPNVVGYLWTSSSISSGTNDSSDSLEEESSSSSTSGTSFDFDYEQLLPPEVSWLQGEIESDDEWDMW